VEVTLGCLGKVVDGFVTAQMNFFWPIWISDGKCRWEVPKASCPQKQAVSCEIIGSMVRIFALFLQREGEDFVDELRGEDEHQCLHMYACIHVELWEWMCLARLLYKWMAPQNAPSSPAHLFSCACL